MKHGGLFTMGFVLLVIICTAVQASALAVTVLGNSIDLPLAAGYLDSFRAEGFDVQTISAAELTQHKGDSVILILGGQHAPEGVGEIVNSIMTQREKDEAVSRPDARVLVVAPNLWAGGSASWSLQATGRSRRASCLATCRATS